MEGGNYQKNHNSCARRLSLKGWEGEEKKKRGDDVVGDSCD